MIRVSVKQVRGDYQCPSYTMIIGKGEEVWQEAYVVQPANSVQHPPGTIEVRNLVFSNFNGVYKMDETGRTSEGRPIYVEQSKADGLSQFDTSVPTFDTSVQPYTQMDPIKPAEIIYCNGRWLLVHDYIKKHEKVSGNVQCVFSTSCVGDHKPQLFLLFHERLYFVSQGGK